jgi:hypothetical protein
MNKSDHISQGTPGDYFDENSFKTLYGGVFVTWVSTNVIVDIWSAVDPKQLGLIIAIIVALIGFLISERRNLKKLLITPFNGFLIYLTILGGTSFLPPPEVTTQDIPVNDTQTEVRESPETRERSAFFRSWTDSQLSSEYSRLLTENQNLSQTRDVLTSENRQLVETNRDLVRTTQVYQARLDSTQLLIQQMNLPPAQQNQLLQQLHLTPQFQHLNLNINPNQ